METNTRQLIEFISSKWLFVCTVLLFIAESSWLAITSRFPMAFDEAYHFGLIQFFSHRLNPIVTYQPSSSYRFGAIVQDPSFLYHYLMSFPYRLIVLFAKSPEIQVIDLRLINVLFAVGTLLTLRKILQLMNISAALTNVLMLTFALTPIVVVLSAQINYDNLLILGVSLSIYATLLFIKRLNNKVFDTKVLLTLFCLGIFTSLVMYSCLPILAAITAIVIWKITRYGRLKTVNLMAQARKDFARISRAPKLLLLVASILGSLLFVRVYVVNIVAYHDPAPQCNQILSVQDCKQYYAWDSNYNLRQDHVAHPKPNTMNILHYTTYWFFLCTLDLFGVIMPLQGLSYISPIFVLFIGIFGAVALVCTIANFKKMLQKNQSLQVVTIISLIYLLTLWARNYHDYLQLGQPVAIDGRYFVPILIYLYVLLAMGVHYTFSSRELRPLAVKTGLALVILYSFVCYGGYNQYISQVDPIYGRINASNSYVLSEAVSS